MVANMEDYVKDDVDGEDDFGYYYRDNMIAQFKQDLYNKTFSFQDEGNCDKNDTLRKRFKFWPIIIDVVL